jgi:hypothetical protein
LFAASGYRCTFEQVVARCDLTLCVISFAARRREFLGMARPL